MLSGVRTAFLVIVSFWLVIDSCCFLSSFRTFEGAFEGFEGSDEEEDISKMDMGGKNRLHR